MTDNGQGNGWEEDVTRDYKGTIQSFAGRVIFYLYLDCRSVLMYAILKLKHINFLFKNNVGTSKVI